MKLFFSLILKAAMLLGFYFWDVATSTSDNRSLNLDTELNAGTIDRVRKTFRSDQIQPIPHRINNRLSDFEDFEYLESGIAAMMGKYNIKGASIAVAKDGRLIFAKGLGYADKEANETVEPRHLFRIASVSKLITAVTIMKLAEMDLLAIDDRVFGKEGILNDGRYLDYTDPRIEEITVRHLMNHSAGWNRRYGDPVGRHHIIARAMNKDWREITAPDIVHHTLRNQLHFTPGSRTSYSNLGYVILGEVIKAITGEDYESFVRNAILAPLGIFDMRIGGSLFEDRFENEVKYYAIEDRQMYPDDGSNPIAYGGNNIEILGAAGGWIASPAEILKLVVAIDSIQTVQSILSPESIELMTDHNLSGGHPMGWAGTDARGNWWRTGTLSGTSALVVRQNDGISWAVFFNSSTYKGIFLPVETLREMRIALNTITEWPDHDLFYHFETRPFLYPDIAELR